MVPRRIFAAFGFVRRSHGSSYRATPPTTLDIPERPPSRRLSLWGYTMASGGLVVKTRSSEAACGPGKAVQREGRFWQQVPAALAKCRQFSFAKSSCVCACRSHTERERPPPLVEACIFDRRRKRGFFNVVQPRCLEQVGEMTRTRTRQSRLVLCAAVELASRLPERREWGSLTGVIPYARYDDALHTRYPGHLGEPGKRIGHEMHDQLRESRIEHAVGVRQVLRRSEPNINAGMSLACRRNERFGRVDGRHRVGPEPPDELSRQGARPAADVEHFQSGMHAAEVRKLGRQPCRIPPHEAVVSLRSDIEAHSATLATDIEARRIRTADVAMDEQPPWHERCLDGSADVPAVPKIRDNMNLLSAAFPRAGVKPRGCRASCGRTVGARASRGFRRTTGDERQHEVANLSYTGRPIGPRRGRRIRKISGCA